MIQPERPNRTPHRWRARPESWWWISLVVLIPVTVLTAIAAVLLAATTHPTGASDQIDLVKTALSVGAGTGGVVALVLAGRRQWHNEQAQRGAEHDATERRITELYTKAADQLGSDKAPVRLAGLYALRRLAQDNIDQRQTIVDVICAYLRMPYTPPTDQPPVDDAPEPEQARFEARIQEREVRLTAQRLLTVHLRPGRDLQHPAATFWPDIDLDLTGATLINFNLGGCHLRIARFDRAHFAGAAGFIWVEFADVARFVGARFAGETRFDEAKFAAAAGFEKAEFAGAVWFDKVEFASLVWFDKTEFAGEARFGEAKFAAAATFDEAEFVGAAAFGGQAWVRMDVPDIVHRSWPAGWEVVPTFERPEPDVPGEWGRLTRSPDPNSA